MLLRTVTLLLALLFVPASFAADDSLTMVLADLAKCEHRSYQPSLSDDESRQLRTDAGRLLGRLYRVSDRKDPQFAANRDRITALQQRISQAARGTGNTFSPYDQRAGAGKPTDRVRDYQQALREASRRYRDLPKSVTLESFRKAATTEQPLADIDRFLREFHEIRLRWQRDADVLRATIPPGFDRSYYAYQSFVEVPKELYKEVERSRRTLERFIKSTIKSVEHQAETAEEPEPLFPLAIGWGRSSKPDPDKTATRLDAAFILVHAGMYLEEGVGGKLDRWQQLSDALTDAYDQNNITAKTLRDKPQRSPPLFQPPAMPVWPAAR